ncbi:N-acetylglucosamine-6-sulfatase-like [Arctopsyche grandis]|uniref:N-acetylglucosamine-6-sulfatase-like n=1 Tax=Arctopsyche grandis TaxID=121162 RepID=UPI00406D688F
MNSYIYFSLAILLCLFTSFKICFAANKPNIVLIITDDQDSVLGGMTPMTKTEKLLQKRGVHFMNSFTSAPICCPSRSSILTGMYPHNHKTVNNTLSGGCSDNNWQENFEPKTFAAILQKDAHYKTFYAGKYLNEYGKNKAGGPLHVPLGWNEWRGLIGNSKYYNFTLSHNGDAISYENGEYLTDIITNEALEFMDSEYKMGLLDPMLIVLAPPAPHAPFTPALRHRNAFEDLHVKETPNFNIPAGEDKHWIMRMPPSPLPNETLEKLDEMYRSRWQTLLSVDDMVEAVVNRFELYNAIDNTYIIFTSDNGYHMGQFSQPFDKRQPYETDIRVPLIVRGPGIDPNVIRFDPIVNVDLAPTILKIAGVEINNSMDGIPLPIFDNSERSLMEPSIETNDVVIPDRYDRQILIEYHGEGSNTASSSCPSLNDTNLFGCSAEYFCKCQDSKNNTYGCVRHLHTTINFVYCAFNDTENFEEAYDLMSDPFQMRNIISEMMPSIKFKYQNILKHLLTCEGVGCNIYNDLI